MKRWQFHTGFASPRKIGGKNMGFLLGFLLGFLGAIGLLVSVLVWLCMRANHIAIAKAVNGLANALATRPKSSKTLTAADDSKAVAGRQADENEEREGIGFRRTGSDG
jgi:hypothetical protein